MNRNSCIKLAAAIAGLANHEDLMRNDPQYAYMLKGNATLLREYQATLGIANRLELLIADAQPPVVFDLRDLDDGSLLPPFPMPAPERRSLHKAMTAYIARSRVSKVQVTKQREVVLLGNFFDPELRVSSLEPVCSSTEEPSRRAS